MAKTKQTKLSILMTMNTKQFNSALARASYKLNQVGKKMQATGRSLSRNLTAPLALIGVASIKAATDFEFAMAKVQAVSGFTTQEVGRLESQAKALGASTSKSASEVASLQLELAKLGKSSTEIEQMTESILSLAIAFDAELGDAASTVGTTLAQFNLDASESTRVADVMAVAFGSSSLDLESFTEAMKNAAPVANEFGFSLEQTTALLGTLADSGIRGSDAGTKLKMALSNIAAEGGDVQRIFQSLIGGTTTYKEALDALGKRSAILVPILGKNGEKLAELQRKLADSAGAAKAARLVLEDTAQGGFDRLKSAAESAGIEIGGVLMPVIQELTSTLTEALGSFAGMTREQKEAKVKAGALAAAIGPLVYIVGKLTSGIGLAIRAVRKLNIAILANPYVLAAAAVTALAIAIYNKTQMLTNAEKLQKRINGIEAKTNSLLAKEASNVKILAVQYKAAAGNLEKRKEILEKLKEINPDIVKGIDAETSSYTDLTKSIDQYLLKLKEKIKAKLQEAELTALIEDEIKLEQQRAEALKELETAQKRYNDTAEKVAKIEASGNSAKSLSILLEGERTDALNDSKEALEEIESQLANNIDAQEQIGKKYEDTTKKADELAESEDALAKAKKKHAEENAILIAAQQAYNEKLEDLLWYMDQIDKREKERKQRLKDIQDTELEFEEIDMGEDIVVEPEIDFTKAEQRTLAWMKTMDTVKATMNNTFYEMGQALQQAIGPFSDAMADLIMGADNAKEKMRELGKQLVKQLLSIAISNAIASALSPLAPENQATAGTSGAVKAAAAPALVAGLFGNIPAFAEGGAVLGPTLALIGEKSGSAGEAIIPFEKMTEFARKAIDTDSLGGGNNVVVTGRISGSDIVISNTRGTRARSRF